MSSKHRSTAVYSSSNVMGGIPAFPGTANPYFITKKSIKKRPASANRKNLMHATAQMKQSLKGGDKSPAANTLVNKKHTILSSAIHHPVLGSAPNHKHRRLVYSQQTGQPDFIPVEEVNGVNNPYHKSLKLASALGVPIPSKTLTTSKMHGVAVGGVFGSPEKVPGKMKNKIP